MPALAPCGTAAAYRRHRRKGEDCETCKGPAAATQQKLRAAREAKQTAEFQAAVKEAPTPEVVNPLQDALENLRIVTAAMGKAGPAAVSGLSKRRQELVALIHQLQNSTEAPTVEDELGKRRDTPRAKQRAARREAGA